VEINTNNQIAFAVDVVSVRHRARAPHIAVKSLPCALFPSPPADEEEDPWW
jgi:hypothetical protein